MLTTMASSLEMYGAKSGPRCTSGAADGAAAATGASDSARIIIRVVSIFTR